MNQKKRFDPKTYKKRPNRRLPADDGQLYIYGLHPVIAALANKQRFKHTLYATPNALAKLEEAGADISAKIKDVTPKKLDEMLGTDAVHQGVALHVKPIERDVLKDLHEKSLVVVLDQVTDPHNVGAILRTACAFGADAVITTMRFAPQETGVLAKSASGALDYTSLIEVKNLGNAIQELRNHGFTCLGFDSEAETALSPALQSDKLAIVLGAEHKGLRQRTRELCDQMVKLDMPGPIKSLNVSNAAAIALFAATSRQSAE
ncbi:23S rRNA (guanosine(2251)-2'-O)-methyltransferase RlmB [Maritalea sp. S77]|uniref:23S rRNA (guanosine(2251)-2'-O)-methyltransferase RlmB n=1 Tax=Maritalea sp. S77 TaxID=3415125 RepID=UPI003C7CBEB9